MQPPSGGCVLKPTGVWFDIISLLAATFGWLCVETTSLIVSLIVNISAATFGWLCVETWIKAETTNDILKQPPSGGCVLKHWPLNII